jgi:hypothetical protein
VTASPYDALLSQMSEVLDMVDSQTSFDNTEARKVFDHCARQIPLATVPDPLYQLQTRPPAINEALNDARATGNGHLHLVRRNDGMIYWNRLDPTTVVLKAPTTQGETS